MTERHFNRVLLFVKKCAEKNFFAKFLEIANFSFLPRYKTSTKSMVVHRRRRTTNMIGARIVLAKTVPAPNKRKVSTMEKSITESNVCQVAATPGIEDPLRDDTPLSDSGSGVVESTTSPTDTPGKERALAWEPFPLDAFPKTLRNYTIESAASLNVDPAYIGPFCLSAVASIIGSSARIQLDADWFQPAIIWTILVTDSGDKKSSALNRAVGPLYTLQEKATRQYQDDFEEYETAMLVYKADLAEWRRIRRHNPHIAPPTKPKEPAPVTYRMKDTTMEALVRILSFNPFGVCMVNDEAAGWVGSFDAYRGGKKDQSQWLELFDGDPIQVDRKTGVTRIYAGSPAVSVCAGIQPTTLRNLLGKQSFFDSGFCARILFASPPIRPQFSSRAVITENTQRRYRELFDTILSWRPVIQPKERHNPRIVRLSPKAKEEFFEFINAIESERTTMVSGPQKAALAKMKGYTARIALVLHTVQEAEGTIPQGSAVTAETMNSSIRLIEWFKREAHRTLYTMLGAVAPVDEDAAAILSVLRKRSGSVSELQPYLRSFRGEGGTERLEKKLREMVSVGLVEVVFEKKGTGRGKEVFRLPSTVCVCESTENTGKNDESTDTDMLELSEIDVSDTRSDISEPAPSSAVCVYESTANTGKTDESPDAPQLSEISVSDTLPAINVPLLPPVPKKRQRRTKEERELAEQQREEKKLAKEQAKKEREEEAKKKREERELYKKMRIIRKALSAGRKGGPPILFTDDEVVKQA